MDRTRTGLPTGSDSSRREDEPIGPICERNRNRSVARSFLPGWSSHFVAIFFRSIDWKEASDKALRSWSWKQFATILSRLATKEMEPFFRRMNRRFEAIYYLPVSPLREQCIEFKIVNVSARSVIDDMRFAERHSITALEDRCMQYLLRKLPDVLRSPRLRRKMNVELLRKVLHHRELNVPNEDEVLSLIDLWCSSEERRWQRVQLLQEVRFAHLTEAAFNRCARDPACLQVLRFRVLLDASRWSDLDESFFCGRSWSRAHLHFVGLIDRPASYWLERESSECDESDDGAFVFCSESGTYRSARGVISENSARAMIRRSCSGVSGKELYVLQADKPFNPFHPFYPFRVRKTHVGGLEHYSNIRDSEASSIIVFPKKVVPLAPPAVFENEVYIIHKLIKGQSTTHRWEFRGVRDEYFDELEVLRYRYGEVTAERLRDSMTPESWERFRRVPLDSSENKLTVNKRWRILCMPTSGLLLVIDKRNGVGATIEMPEPSWKLDFPSFLKCSTFSDVVIVGKVAFVLLKFVFGKIIAGDSFGALRLDGSRVVGNITAYDLTEGKYLTGHHLDLTSVLDRQDHYDLFFKVVEGEVHLIGWSSGCGMKGSSSSLLRYFVYRIRASAGRLRMTLVRDGVAEEKTETLTDFCRWRGVPIEVDAHICENATMLQRRASRESDPIRREKLRRFIW